MTSYTAHTKTHNEGGYGFNPHEAAMLAAAHAAADARMSDLIGRAAEVRAAWNAAIAKHTVNGLVPTAALKLIEAEAGVTMLEMTSLKARLTK